MSDLDELKLLLDECARRKLVVSGVSVGGIRLALVPQAAAEEKEKPRPKTAEEKELEALRRSSRKTFGRVLPDEELLNLKGTI